MKPIAIYGAGSFGREVFVLIMQINDLHKEWKLIGFFDDNLSTEDSIHGYPILGTIDELNQYDHQLNVVVAIGNPKVRKKIVKRITNPNINFPVLVHPSVQIAPYQNISIGEGTIICANTILTVDISIGKHVLLNLACKCGHDLIIGDFVSIMPNCILSGDAQIRENCFISTGAIILNRIDLPPGSRVGVKETVMNAVSRIL